MNLPPAGVMDAFRAVIPPVAPRRCWIPIVLLPVLEMPRKILWVKVPL